MKLSILHLFIGATYLTTIVIARRGRVIAGIPIKIEDAPYQVLIIDGLTGAKCGGSIISSRLVLTAAHCTLGLFAGFYALYSGLTYAKNKTSGQTHQVTEMFAHDDFEMNGQGRPSNDIGLMLIDPPFKFDDKTKKVDLPPKDKDIEIRSEALVTGWGIMETGEPADQLMGLSVKIINTTACHESYQDLDGLSENQFCAANPDAKGDFCFGDSGGPLVIRESNTQIGVVSWSGPPCPNPNGPLRPGVYTKVAGYRDWIDKFIEQYP